MNEDQRKEKEKGQKEEGGERGEGARGGEYKRGYQKQDLHHGARRISEGESWTCEQSVNECTSRK